MIMGNFLRNRKSVREFKKKPLDLSILEKVEDVVEEVRSSLPVNGVDFRLYEKGEILQDALKDIGGYSGVMIDSPHYIIMDFKDDSEETMIYGAYYMEKLITDLNNMGISTCWITLPHISEDLEADIFAGDVGRVNYLLAIGYERLQNPFEADVFSERISVDEMVFDGKIGRQTDIDDLEARALMEIFYYVRFAPSHKNLQPWRFLLGEDKLELILEFTQWSDDLLIDAGIIMYYFSVLAKAQGISNDWKLINRLEEDDKGDKKYRFIGEYKL